MMKTCRPLALLLVSTLLLAVCGDNDKTQAGDFGQIQIPDVSQLVQMAEAEAETGSSSVTFTTLAAWSTSIRETRTETPEWISISPNHGDLAGDYTIRITLQPNFGQQSRTAIIPSPAARRRSKSPLRRRPPQTGRTRGTTSTRITAVRRSGGRRPARRSSPKTRMSTSRHTSTNGSTSFRPSIRG